MDRDRCGLAPIHATTPLICATTPSRAGDDEMERSLRREAEAANRRGADAAESDPLLALGLPHAAIGERQLDVLVDGEVADQVEALEDETDLAVSHARAVGHREPQRGRPWTVSER